MIELTPQDGLELFAIGTGVSASVALVMQVPAHYIKMLKQPLRGLLLRLVPLLLGIAFTVALFPVAIIYFTAVDLHSIGLHVTVPLGLICGAGATYAYDLWKGVARQLLERFSNGSN